MKIFNCLSKQILFVALLLQLSFVCFSQSKLTVKWGIENTRYFQEVKATREQSSAYFPKAKPNDKFYRFFKPTSAYESTLQIFFERHSKLWDKFEDQTKADSLRTKLNFVKFAKEQDPYFYGIAKSLAPQVYFDFIGETKEYVLESIDVTTIRFDEYSGGGFSDKEAWYDIELKHIPGIYNYPVDSKLRFTGSGRATLRFWSDNYYKSFGMTPSGCYMISIKFNFIVDGKKLSVSTNAFKIDV
jgi:hypothetical protein